MDPITAESTSSFSLVQGWHRQPGARYVVTFGTPELALSPSRSAEFDRKQAQLVEEDASDDVWRANFERRRAASVQVGSTSTRLTVRLNHDDAQRMAATITDADERWTVDVGLRHGRFPHVDLAGWMQLTRFLTDEGAPGCLAGLLGRTGEGRATLDLAALEAAGGTLVVAEGRANRFLSSARLHVDPTAVSWRVDGDLVLRARGLGRVVLLLAGRRARRNVERWLEEFWAVSEEWISGVERNLREISVMVEREGGAAAFVHRALWDPDFDPRPPGGRT